MQESSDNAGQSNTLQPESSPRKAEFCPKKAKKIKDRMLNKRQQVLFTRKVALIERHLKDSSHPLRWLQRQFSKELEEYYELFLEENRRNAAANTASASDPNVTQSQRSIAPKVVCETLGTASKDNVCEVSLLSGSADTAHLGEKSHRKFIKQSVLTQYMQGNHTNSSRLDESDRSHLSQSRLTHSASQSGANQAVTYTPEQIRTMVEQSVHAFIFIFKTALFKFYRIKSYMRSQEDMFMELVTSRVLDRQVSEVLVKARRAEHLDETLLFKKALRHMSAKPLTFWVSPSDSQFWLDEERHREAAALRKQLTALEQESRQLHAQRSQQSSQVYVEPGLPTFAAGKAAAFKLGSEETWDVEQERRSLFLKGEIASLTRKLEELKLKPGSDPEKQPYSSAIQVMSTLGAVRSLPKFKSALKYSWAKLQTEAQRYWRKREISQAKTVINEDARLMVIAFVLTQVESACEDFVPRLLATQAFINEQLYEECAPLATFEAACKVVQFEYEESKAPRHESSDSDAARAALARSSTLGHLDRHAVSGRAGKTSRKRQARAESSFVPARSEQSTALVDKSTQSALPSAWRNSGMLATPQKNAGGESQSMLSSRRSQAAVRAPRPREVANLKAALGQTSEGALARPDCVASPGTNDLVGFLISGQNQGGLPRGSTANSNLLGLSYRSRASSNTNHDLHRRTQHQTPNFFTERLLKESEGSMKSLSRPNVEEYQPLDEQLSALGATTDLVARAAFGSDLQECPAILLEEDTRETIAQRYRQDLQWLKRNHEVHRRTLIETDTIICVAETGSRLDSRATMRPFSPPGLKKHDFGSVLSRQQRSMAQVSSRTGRTTAAAPRRQRTRTEAQGASGSWAPSTRVAKRSVAKP